MHTNPSIATTVTVRIAIITVRIIITESALKSCAVDDSSSVELEGGVGEGVRGGGCGGRCEWWRVWWWRV